MRRSAVVLVLAPFLLVALAAPIAATGRFVPKVDSPRGKGVVVLECDSSQVDAGDPIPASAVSATRGAPDIDADPTGRGDECAEALSRLLGARFKIKDVSPTGSGVFYTLGR